MSMQKDEIHAAVEHMFQSNNLDMEVSVHRPEPYLSVMIGRAGGHPRRSGPVGGGFVSVPTPDDTARVAWACERGFETHIVTRSHPFKDELVTQKWMDAEYASVEQAVELCLVALDAHGVGDEWLWITGEEYDYWPDPLPRPDTWPPK